MVLKEVKWLSFKVIGKWAPHHAPYIISLKINDVENCYEPHRTYFSLFESLGVTKFFEAPDQLCGRRKIDRKYTDLIVNDSPTKYGDWPWHAAIYRYRKASLKYICGGTLITKVLVLTSELHESLIPGVDDSTCIKKEPIFYSTMLDGKEFCAGYSNDTWRII
nr:uncharacterized protein LOC116766871 [Danaus plexippus plexippus]